MINFIKNNWKNFHYKNYLLFVGLALFLWLIMQLSREHTFAINTQIQLVDFPKDVSPSKNEILVTSSYSGTGFSYLINKPMWSQYKLPVKSLTDTISSYRVSVALLDSLYASNTRYSSALPSVTNFSEKVDYKQIEAAFLPIEPKLEIHFQKSFDFFAPIEFELDSIQVIGEKETILKLNSISTEPKEYYGISKSFTDKIALVVPKEKGHVLAQEKIGFSVEVEQYTEVEFLCPIQLYNSPEFVEVMLFPETVVLSCKVPINQARKLTSSNFQVRVNYNLVERGFSKLPIEVGKLPNFVKDVWMDQTEVSLYQLKK